MSLFKFTIYMNFSFFESASHFTKFVFSVFVLFVSMLIFIVLGLIIAIPVFGIEISDLATVFNNMNKEDIPFMKFIQGFQSVGMFIVPAVILAYLYSEKGEDYLFARRKPLAISLLISAIVMIFSIPVINLTASLNSQMTLPESLSWLEEAIKNSEEKARQITELFLNVDNTSGLMVNILIIAIIPAIGEEFLFRGIIQRLFADWTKNIHWGIIISAIIFSGFHMQFYGFVPRVLMGILFGYMLYWSKNIWIPITAHFVNNATAVIAYYILKGTSIESKAENLGTEASQLPFTFLSIIIISGLLYYFVKIEKSKKKQTVNQIENMN